MSLKKFDKWLRFLCCKYCTVQYLPCRYMEVQKTLFYLHPCQSLDVKRVAVNALPVPKQTITTVTSTHLHKQNYLLKPNRNARFRILGLVSCHEMGFTKNKNPSASLYVGFL
jgi:hypothetical protein